MALSFIHPVRFTSNPRSSLLHQEIHAVVTAAASCTSEAITPSEAVVRLQPSQPLPDAQPVLALRSSSSDTPPSSKSKSSYISAEVSGSDAAALLAAAGSQFPDLKVGLFVCGPAGGLSARGEDFDDEICITAASFAATACCCWAVTHWRVPGGAHPRSASGIAPAQLRWRSPSPVL